MLARKAAPSVTFTRSSAKKQHQHFCPAACASGLEMGEKQDRSMGRAPLCGLMMPFASIVISVDSTSGALSPIEASHKPSLWPTCPLWHRQLGRLP